ncbi:uncharacterized protein LOC111373703 [Olea europaea var. sylvestris]|uniref:uncharacterized protein LOC111373703 n=1 Tax=Olea europaea var. sylvestris TaxID=158386 RepID=UPI000C1D6F97|nr:uncharacterized protein LOC111373703 [Olea europaea var. sylvestris]
MKPSTSSLPPKIFPTIIHSFFAIFHSSSSPLKFFPKIIHFLSLPLQLNRPKPNSNSSIDAVSCQQITTQSTDFYVILQAIFRDEIFIKEYEYLVERAKRQQLLEDLSWEKIPVDDREAVINIMMYILSTKLGRQILGLGDGYLRDIHSSSSNVHSLENELETKCATTKVADAARV